MRWKSHVRFCNKDGIEKHNYLESELEYHNKKLKKKNKGSEVEPVFSGAHRKIPIKKVNDEHERNIEVER